MLFKVLKLVFYCIQHGNRSFGDFWALKLSRFVNFSTLKCYDPDFLFFIYMIYWSWRFEIILTILTFGVSVSLCWVSMWHYIVSNHHFQENRTKVIICCPGCMADSVMDIKTVSDKLARQGIWKSCRIRHFFSLIVGHGWAN